MLIYRATWVIFSDVSY